MKPATQTPSLTLRLVAAVLLTAAATVAEADDTPRSSTSTQLAGLSITAKVEGGHVAVTATPADATLEAIAFPGAGRAGSVLLRQPDGTLMVTLPNPAPDTLAVVLAVTDHAGKRQEACVMPIDHAATCTLAAHWVHVHTSTGHEFKIERSPDGGETGE